MISLKIKKKIIIKIVMEINQRKMMSFDFKEINYL